MRLTQPALLVVSLLLAVTMSPRPAGASSCQFVLGFKTLHDMISNTVGDCLVDEHHNGVNGDGLQETTGPVGGSGTGLLVWRKADNWTAYTDGYRTWINGPNGLQERMNTECFAWEAGCAPTSLSALPILLPVASTDMTGMFNTLRSTDQAAFIFEGYYSPPVGSVTQGQVDYAYGSWSAMQAALAGLPSRVTAVLYNPEHGPHTDQSEQQNLVATVAAASAGVHATGRSFVVVPDSGFTQQYARQIAPYADAYIIQAQRYQGNLGQFDSFVSQTTQAIKSANPACKVWVQIQIDTQTGTTATFSPNGAYSALQSLATLPDGIAVWTFKNQVSAVQQFFSLLRPLG